MGKREGFGKRVETRVEEVLQEEFIESGDV